MVLTGTKSKLTLWVDKETKQFGKEWAKRHQESLSQIVSVYLLRLHAAEKTSSATPLVQKLAGVVKGSRLERAAYRKYLQKKYLGA